MRPRFVVFEGYDGAGKSTMIDGLRGTLGSPSVRVVGRKNEPELHEISRLVEETNPRPTLAMLLRIGLEMERGYVIERAVSDGYLTCCDRGVVSLDAWFDYLDVSRTPFEPLMDSIRDRYRSSVIFVCSADFDTCWSRIAERTDPSPKEQLGKAANRRFFADYERGVERHQAAGFDTVFVDTVESSVADSMQLVINALSERGIWPSPETRPGDQV